MAKNRYKNDDPVFLLRGAGDEIYLIDDPEMIDKLEVTIKIMKGKSEDEITEQLIKIVHPERYGKRL